MRVSGNVIAALLFLFFWFVLVCFVVVYEKSTCFSDPFLTFIFLSFRLIPPLIHAFTEFQLV